MFLVLQHTSFVSHIFLFIYFFSTKYSFISLKQRVLAVSQLLLSRYRPRISIRDASLVVSDTYLFCLHKYCLINCFWWQCGSFLLHTCLTFISLLISLLSLLPQYVPFFVPIWFCLVSSSDLTPKQSRTLGRGPGHLIEVNVGALVGKQSRQRLWSLTGWLVHARNKCENFTGTLSLGNKMIWHVTVGEHSLATQAKIR